MRFVKEILAEVLRDLEHARADRASKLASRRAQVYAQVPRIAAIDRALSRTAATVLMHALSKGEDPETAVARIAAQNQALQQERRQLLVQNNFADNYLDETYACDRCSDFGYVGQQPCECLLIRYREKLTASLSSFLPINDQNFTTFRLDYYPSVADARTGVAPRDIMSSILLSCKNFAYNFASHQQNLLLFGSTGLGKTFLSSAIAKVVSEQGFSVCYDTSIHIFAAYESVRFRAGDMEEARKRIYQYEHSDLLILDDLGTEMSTQFNTSTFYQLLSTRLMAGRSMIINTNLLPTSLAGRYSDAIASRLYGDFEHLRFMGEDIRILKKRQRF